MIVGISKHFGDTRTTHCTISLACSSASDNCGKVNSLDENGNNSTNTDSISK